MRRISLSNVTQTHGNLPGDGAELPLLRPGLLAHIGRRANERCTVNLEGDWLTLSEDWLGSYAQCMTPERAAFSDRFRRNTFGRDSAAARRRVGSKRIVSTIVMIALAVAVGVTIGSVL